MDPVIGSALIGGAVNAVTSLFGTKMTNEARKREAEYAYKKQQEAVDKQNAYNSPAAQVTRLAAAGLNPNVVYGANGQVTGEQTATPEYTPAPLDNPVGQLGQVGSEMINSTIGLKDLRNKTALTAAQIATENSEAYCNWLTGDKTKAETQTVLETLGFNREMWPKQLEGQDLENAYKKAKIDLTEDERKEIQSKIGLNNAQITRLAVENGVSSVNCYIALKKLQPEIDYIKAETYRTGVDALKIIAEKDSIKQKIGYYSSEFELEIDKWQETKRHNQASEYLTLKGIRRSTTNTSIDAGAKLVGIVAGAAMMPNRAGYRRQLMGVTLLPFFLYLWKTSLYVY